MKKIQYLLKTNTNFYPTKLCNEIYQHLRVVQSNNIQKSFSIPRTGVIFLTIGILHFDHQRALVQEVVVVGDDVGMVQHGEDVHLPQSILLLPLRQTTQADLLPYHQTAVLKECNVSSVKIIFTNCSGQRFTQKGEEVSRAFFNICHCKILTITGSTFFPSSMFQKLRI